VAVGFIWLGESRPLASIAALIAPVVSNTYCSPCCSYSHKHPFSTSSYYYCFHLSQAAVGSIWLGESGVSQHRSINGVNNFS